MPMEAADIVQLYEQRRNARGHILNRMLEVQRMYDNEVMVPLPELERSERPAVANLLIQGVDQLGMRLSSRLPDVDFVSTKQGDKAADLLAEQAANAVKGWWDMNSLQKKLGRRSRYLVAYGCAPAMVKPVGIGFTNQRVMPYWHILNPLSVLPNVSGDPDDIEPHDVIVVRRQSLAWLRKVYPVQANMLYKGKKATLDTMYDLLEYNDDQETVLVVRGALRSPREYVDPAAGTAACLVLERSPNPIGMCHAVVPGRITLSKLSGHFDQIIGMFMAQAKLTAYELIAIRKGIFPELWAVTHPGSPGQARIVTIADGRTGTIGVVEGGTIMPINPQPGQQVTQAVDRLERAARVQASIPADWGGESASNIRTAKRGEQVSSSASDPTLAELQTVLAEALCAENFRAIAWSKHLRGNKSTSFYITRTGKNVSDDYKPNEAFKSDFHFVKYSMPGVDAAGIPIELGQRTGNGELSQYTARRLDPMVEDADFEDRQVDREGVRKAMLAQLEQPGAVDPHELAYIIQLMGSPGKQIEDAIDEAHDHFQKQQAALAQSAPGAAETQPGLAQAPPPGAPAAGGPPPPLAQLLQGLRGPTEQSGAEKALSPAGGG